MSFELTSISRKTSSKGLKEKRKRGNSRHWEPYKNLQPPSAYYCEEDEESIHLSDHVGSFYSKPPIFGYPVLNFSDINSDHYLAEESDTELFFQSSNSRNMINPTRRSF